MYNIIKNVCYYCSIVLLLCHCNNNNSVKTDFFENGTVKKIKIINGNVKKVIEFFDNGEIKKVLDLSDTAKLSEQLSFHQNGLLKSKIFLQNGVAENVGYWFYPSGALYSSQNFIKGKPNDVGFNYWDDYIVIIKSLSRYDDNGKEIFKQYFDSSGKPTTHEGDIKNSDMKVFK